MHTWIIGQFIRISVILNYGNHSLIDYNLYIARIHSHYKSLSNLLLSVKYPANTESTSICIAHLYFLYKQYPPTRAAPSRATGVTLKRINMANNFPTGNPCWVTLIKVSQWLTILKYFSTPGMRSFSKSCEEKPIIFNRASVMESMMSATVGDEPTIHILSAVWSENNWNKSKWVHNRV